MVSQAAVDTCFSDYLNEKKNTTKKATRSGLQHTLRLVGLPKVDDSAQSLLYPDTARVLRSWALVTKDSPQEVTSAARLQVVPSDGGGGQPVCF